MSSKGAQLHHDFSECSTHFREDLGEGSLSCFISDDGAGAPPCGAPSTGAGAVSRGLAARQPMVLVQLKRLAPKEGRLTADCSTRVPRADRQYDLLLEVGPREAQEAPLARQESGGVTWQSSLRRKKKVRLRPMFRPSAPPLQLVTAFRRPKTVPSKAARPRLRHGRNTPRQEVDAYETGLPPDLVPKMSLVIHEPEDAQSNGSSELGLPSSLNEELEGLEDSGAQEANSTMRVDAASARSKDPVHWAATWPLNSSAPSDALSGDRSVNRQNSLPVPDGHRYSMSARRLSERRRSWLKASEASKGKNPGFLSQRNQLRDMVSTMMKTMTQTFDRAVWDACDVIHPDEEIEQANALQKKVLEDQIDQFKGLKPAIKGRRSSTRRASTRRSFGITAGASFTTVTPPGLAEKPDEKVLAHLAKQTNWSVLDVEEVWEVFSSHAPSGRIGVNSQDFVLLVQELYQGVTDEEIMLLQQHMKAVRTRNKARSRLMRKALTGGILEITTEKSDVRFSEFYVALVKWLTLQEARVEASRWFFNATASRCTLTRFAYQDSLQHADVHLKSGGATEKWRTASDGTDGRNEDMESGASEDENLEEQGFLSVPRPFRFSSSQRSSVSSTGDRLI